MASISSLSRYRINGVIDTAKPVMQNLENISNSAGSWLTYDVTDGKWSVVINKAGTSTFSFDDSNIVGGVNVFGTGLDKLYNSVEVQFPNKDLDDGNDFVRIDLTSGQRKSAEPDNLMKLNYPLVNEPVQAQLLAFLELKQSRVDHTVEFIADYTASSVTAGDVIDITNTAHSYTNKLFRVLQTEEINTGASIQIKITALEYDADVYNEDFSRTLRSNADGVISIGDIGKMATPTVTRIGGVPAASTPGSGESKTAALPRLLIESTVPDNTDANNQAGIVEGVEVWYYNIPNTELPSYDTVDDDARIYHLHSVVRPGNKVTTQKGEVFDPGEEIDYEITDFTTTTGYSGNFLIKLRAINSTTKGPFSTRSGLVNYVPTQKTDMIDDNTGVDTGSGNILTTFGMAALMSLLNGLMRDGTASSGSLFKKIFDVFQGDTGVDLLDSSKKPINCVDAYSYVDGYIIKNHHNVPNDGCLKTELIPANPTFSEEVI